MNVTSRFKYIANGALLGAILVTLLAGCGGKSSGGSNRSKSRLYDNGHYPPYRDYEDYDDEDGYREGVDDVFDPYNSLDEDWGDWLEIGGERFWRPDLSNFDGEDDWQPYQHGCWSYDSDEGWTWVSYERWGSITDHYGVWRHHQRYGWIWLPFKDRRYRPATVTWFDEGDYVGWYPYFNDYADGYRLNNRHGFDDGYWNGFSASVNGGNFRLGFTLMNRGDVTGNDVYERRVRDRDFIRRLAARAHSDDSIRRRRVGIFPGGTRENAFSFLSNGSNFEISLGNSTFRHRERGFRFFRPENDRVMPRHERDRWGRRHHDGDTSTDSDGGRRRRHGRRDSDNGGFQPQVRQDSDTADRVFRGGRRQPL